MFIFRHFLFPFLRMDCGVDDVSFLTHEIERLTRELDQTNSEKIQSAQYGIVLLEEKEGLQRKCEDLESLYENTRHELALTQEVRVFNLYRRNTFSC